MSKEFIDRIVANARKADQITLHRNRQGEVYVGMMMTERLATGDEIEAVARVMIDRLHDPAAPKVVVKDEKIPLIESGGPYV